MIRRLNIVATRKSANFMQDSFEEFSERHGLYFDSDSEFNLKEFAEQYYNTVPKTELPKFPPVETVKNMVVEISGNYPMIREKGTQGNYLWFPANPSLQEVKKDLPEFFDVVKEIQDAITKDRAELKKQPKLPGIRTRGPNKLKIQEGPGTQENPWEDLVK